MPIETPKYDVLQKDGKFEVRKYLEYIIASVETDTDFRHALNQGFGILADYIFGNNQAKTNIEMTAPVTGQAMKSTKIEMTAPVTSSKIGEGKKYLVSFTMPSKYSLENLPEPINKRISLQKIASHQAAALRFSGYINEKTISKKTKELETWLNKNNLKAKSYIVAQYNPPWIPGMFRRNEIIAELS